MKVPRKKLTKPVPPTEVKKAALVKLEEIRDGSTDTKHREDLDKQIELLVESIELDEMGDFDGGNQAFNDSMMVNGFNRKEEEEEDEDEEKGDEEEEDEEEGEE